MVQRWKIWNGVGLVLLVLGGGVWGPWIINFSSISNSCTQLYNQLAAQNPLTFFPDYGQFETSCWFYFDYPLFIIAGALLIIGLIMMLVARFELKKRARENQRFFEEPDNPEPQYYKESDRISSNDLQPVIASSRLGICNAHNSVMSYDTEGQTYFLPSVQKSQ